MLDHILIKEAEKLFNSKAVSVSNSPKMEIGEWRYAQEKFWYKRNETYLVGYKITNSEFTLAMREFNRNFVREYKKYFKYDLGY